MEIEVKKEGVKGVPSMFTFHITVKINKPEETQEDVANAIKYLTEQLGIE